MLKSVGLVARFDKKPALKLTEELAEYLSGKGLKVSIEQSLADLITLTKGHQFIPLREMKTDFVVSIGGDGTILRACINLPKPEPPIIGINMGVRGFLTEVEPKDAYQAIDRILTGDYKIEKCTKLAISTGDEELPDALNDVVISAGAPSKIFYAEICKDGKSILKSQADGLIVATQTGSTGYSLSAGGPVLDREVEGFVLTPICSLTVFHSLIFPPDAVITFNVIRPQEMLVNIDGQFRKLVSKDEPKLRVCRSKNVTSFIRFESNFYDRLRNRLLFKGTE